MRRRPFQIFLSPLLLAALALNDSGLVSAATAIVYAVVPFLIIAFRKWSPVREAEEN